MLSEFDPIMQQYIQHISNDDIHVHYLGPSIQNELINFLANVIRSEILRKVEEVKYFSMLFCTPNASHQEQMSYYKLLIHLKVLLPLKNHF